MPRKPNRGNERLDDHVLLTIRKLLANLIGEKSRLHEMRENRINADDIPENYKVERSILDMLYIFHARELPPTAENLADSLIEMGYADEVHRLANEATEDRAIAPLAFIIKRIYLRKARNLSLVERIREAFNSSEGLPEEHLRAAMRLVASELPRAYTGMRVTDIEGFEYIENVLRQRVELRASGLPVGPTFPFPKLRQMIPVLMKGNLNTIMAKRGVGKTAMGIVLAMYWAWQQGYDVLFIHLETTTEQLWYRIIANKCLISVDQQKVGLVDPNGDNPGAIKIAEFKQQLLANPNRGRIIFEHAPAATPEDIEAKIIMAREESEARGKELCVIVDYYQQIDLRRWKNDSVPLDSCADWLKILSETQNIYLTIFCQEHEKNEVPHGGFNIIRRSQIFIRFRREMVSLAANRLWWGSQINPAVDTMGKPRVKQSPGDLSAEAYLDVIKANDDQMGSVRLITEMAYYRMKQDDPDYQEER